MVREGKKTNPKSLCVICWCFLTYAQKINHPVEHIKEMVKPVGKYANLDGFTSFALSNGQCQEKNDQLYYEKIKSKPPSFMQKNKPEEIRNLKKMKIVNKEEEGKEKEENQPLINVKLEQRSYMDLFSQESNSNRSQKPSKKKSHEVFQLVFDFADFMKSQPTSSQLNQKK